MLRLTHRQPGPIVIVCQTSTSPLLAWSSMSAAGGGRCLSNVRTGMRLACPQPRIGSSRQDNLLGGLRADFRLLAWPAGVVGSPPLPPYFLTSYSAELRHCSLVSLNHHAWSMAEHCLRLEGRLGPGAPRAPTAAGPSGDMREYSRGTVTRLRGLVSPEARIGRYLRRAPPGPGPQWPRKGGSR